MLGSKINRYNGLKEQSYATSFLSFPLVESNYFMFLPMQKIDRGTLEQAIQNGADLRKLDLSDLNLQGINLEGKNLQEVNFENSNLQDSNLKNTNLGYSNLEHAMFAMSTLKDVNMSHANITNAEFVKVEMHDVNLKYAGFKKAYFEEETLQNVCLQYVINIGEAHFNYTSITLKYEDRLNEVFDHLSRRSNSSILTVIDSINNQYAELKINSMEQVFTVLQDRNINSINPALEDVLFNGNFDYSQVLHTNQLVCEKIISSTINKGNREKITLSDRQLLFFSNYLT